MEANGSFPCFYTFLPIWGKFTATAICINDAITNFLKIGATKPHAAYRRE